ncbi:hypothetical protein [Streptomyces sp. NPDC004284]|uniref:hypothetical protein n=1 Tax=Streptomyces sp. NPDC004284 TaxID=3364695 RepID=UPI0036A96178
MSGFSWKTVRGGRRALTAWAIAAAALVGGAVAPASAADRVGPADTARPALRHVTIAPRPVSPQVAQQIKEGSRAKGADGRISGASEWTTGWAYWTTPDGLTQRVRMHVYLDYGPDGKLHDYAWGEAYLYHTSDELYLDVSNTSGNGHWPWRAQRGFGWTGDDALFVTNSATYDGPGYWVRACGVSWSHGDPWGSPQWGVNINCTGWN